MSVNVHVTWNRTSRGLAVKLNRVTLVALLWAASLAMMTWDTIGSPMGQLGRWALFIGMASSVWTVALLLSHHRAVILEVMSFEHRVMYRDGGGDGASVTHPERPAEQERDSEPPVRRRVVPMQRS